MPATFRRPLAVTMLLACVSALGAQGIVRPIPRPDVNTTRSSLAALVAHSDIIFSGQVASVELRSLRNWITVRFNVETGVRGAAPGLFVANFIESSPGAFPLRPGERLIALLHGRNAAGITAFVASGCGLFKRTGGDRVDLERLHFCPALHRSFLALLPEPVKSGPDPRNFLQEKSNSGAFSPIAGRVPPRTLPASISLDTAASMKTEDFLQLLSTIANQRLIRTGVYPETRAISDPNPSGVR